ncbi:MAG TPA: hypothetical protein VGX25_28830 [Actinophytocola sp.]|uniref:hypothetical protein n=1 Tax=Actinophytocola sp. TaxID=1872138 RepID=UPI002DDCBDC3|nr:hypothetical protein [Actinophytocola sp.]HEV2783408.1 hypothetical protein [Actinophytocola sp.]
MSLVVSPKGSELPSPVAGQPDNTAVRGASTPDGRHVLLVSEPDIDGGDPPYESDLQRMVDELKNRV